MNARCRWKPAVCAGLLALAAFVRPASAETILCTTIPTVPFWILAPGTYCLTGDLTTAMTSGAAITIEANNVVLDLNGHKIGGLGAGPGTSAIGVYAYKRQNITVRNGTIRGFWAAIALDDSSPYTSSQGHLVEDVRADQSTAIGIAVFGTGSVVRRNQIVATGGSTGPGLASGIYGLGIGHRVLDNDVIGVVAPGSGGIGAGILFASSGEHMVVGNRITQAPYGLVLPSSGLDKYRDNLTSSVGTPYTGGLDAGNND